MLLFLTQALLKNCFHITHDTRQNFKDRRCNFTQCKAVVNLALSLIDLILLTFLLLAQMYHVDTKHGLRSSF